MLMTSTLHLRIVCLTLSFLCFFLSNSFLSDAQTDYRLYQTKAFESSQGILRYTELAIPAELEDGATAFVRIKFQNKDGEKAILGYQEQAYRLEEAPTLANKSNVFNLTRIEATKTIGKPGPLGLIDNLILEKGRRFMYPITLDPTDNVIYFHDNTIGKSVSVDLSYKGLESNLKPNKKKHFLLSLLDDDEQVQDPTPAEKISVTRPKPEDRGNIDLAALKEEREYQSFVLNTGEAANRGDHIIRVVYHVPELLKKGSLIRVLAVKSTSDAQEVLALFELDYYVKTVAQEGGETVYFLESLPDLAKVKGGAFQLTRSELEAFSKANGISILMQNGNKGLGIQHGPEAASLALYVGMTKM